MDEHATLVPASADRVIGVMNQKIDTGASGKAVLRGDLMNESGTTVNIPHVIARPGSRRPADYQHLQRMYRHFYLRLCDIADTGYYPHVESAR